MSESRSVNKAFKASKTNIFARDLFLLIAFLGLMNTGYLATLAPRAIVALSSYGVAFGVLMSLRGLHISKASLALFAMYAVVLISTALNGGPVILAASELLPSLTMVIIIEICAAKNILNDAIRIFAYAGVVMILIDFVSFLLYPKGMYAGTLYEDNWFLGYKTARVRIGLPILTFLSLWSYAKKRKVGLFVYIMYIILALCAYLSDGAMGLVCVLSSMVVLLLISLPIGRAMKRLFDFRIWIIVGYVVALLVYFVGTNSLLDEFLISIGRDPTFTGRTYIWSATIREFLKSPLIGFGYIDTNAYQLLTGVGGGTQAHSLLLSVLGLSGILGTIFFCLAHKSAFQRYVPTGKADFQNIIALNIVSGVLMGITSCTFYATFTFPMLVLMSYSDSLKAYKINR